MYSYFTARETHIHSITHSGGEADDADTCTTDAAIRSEVLQASIILLSGLNIIFGVVAIALVNGNHVQNYY